MKTFLPTLGSVMASVMLAAHAQAECPHDINVEGPTLEVSSLVAALESHGVRAEEESPCAPESVHVTRTELGGIEVLLVNGDQSVTRAVSDLTTAAAWIQSWRGANGLLAIAEEPVAETQLEPADPAPDSGPDGEQGPLPEAVGDVEVDDAPPADDLDVAREAAVAPERALTVMLDVFGDVAVGEDGSLWAGASGMGCVIFGPVCVGLLGRFTADTEVEGEGHDHETSRFNTDLMLVVDFPIAWPSFELRVGAEVGLYFSNRVGPAFDSDYENGGLRVGAHVLAGIPLAEDWVLDFGVIADSAPFAVTEPRLDDHGNGLVAGEPILFVHSVIGVRYEL